MSRFGEYLRIKKHKGEKDTPLCPEVCARLLKNQESIRKNILLLLVLILSPMVCYSEIPTEIEKPLKAEVRLGYEPNHFSPTNDLQLNTDSVKVDKKVEEDSIADTSIYVVCCTFMFYVILFGVLLFILTALGLIMLMVAKIIQVYRKKR
jgi:hypothetical protein